MTEKDLINALRALKQERPDQKWVIFCRQNLMREMGIETAKKTSILSKAAAVFIAAANAAKFRAILKPAAILAGVFVFIFGNGFRAVYSAKASLPGDRLYPVKIALEQARLMVTPSQEGKTKIQNEIVVSRLAELDRVINAGDSFEAKQPKIEEAVSNLQKQLLTVKEELPKIENMEARKVVEMAKKIDDNAAEAHRALDQAKLALSPKSQSALSEKISEVAEEADKTSAKALEMMIKKQPDGNGEVQKEILAKLDERIQKTESAKKSLEAIAKSAGGKEFSTNAVIILDETDKVIEQARLKWQSGDIEGAMQTIKAANEMVKSVQRMVEAADIADDNNQSGDEIDKDDTKETDGDISDSAEKDGDDDDSDIGAATSTEAR